MKISFLGLGIMGSRMAHNLLKSNAEVTVWNRSASATETFHNTEALIATSANEAVSEADIVFTMLSNPEAVTALMTSTGGVLSAMKKGAIWADCSTVNPSFSASVGEEAEKHGIRFIDSPVAGSKMAGQNGELVFFCGGDEATIESCRPYMEVMGKKAMSIGPEVGKGASLKMLVNVMLAQSMVVFSETIHLGKQMGLNEDMLLAMLPNLPVIAPFTQHKTAAMKSGDHSDVHFPLEHMQKDVHLATLTAYELGQPMYLANLTKDLFAGAKASGMGRMDFGAIHKFLEN